MELTDSERSRLRAFVDGLRQAADFFETNELRTPFLGGNFYVTCADAAALGEAALLVNKTTKQTSDASFSLEYVINEQVRVVFFALREHVCKRVQVGTEKKLVRRELQPAKYIEEEQEVPVYEWDCPSVLKAFLKKENDTESSAAGSVGSEL